jgi:hypothetical protein
MAQAMTKVKAMTTVKVKAHSGRDEGLHLDQGTGLGQVKGPVQGQDQLSGIWERTHFIDSVRIGQGFILDLG